MPAAFTVCPQPLGIIDGFGIWRVDAQASSKHLQSRTSSQPHQRRPSRRAVELPLVLRCHRARSGKISPGSDVSRNPPLPQLRAYRSIYSGRSRRRLNIAGASGTGPRAIAQNLPRFIRSKSFARSGDYHGAGAMMVRRSGDHHCRSGKVAAVSTVSPCQGKRKVSWRVSQAR